MPIKRNISDVPRRGSDGGWPPDENPDIAGPLLDAWYAQYLEDEVVRDGDARAVPGTWMRASWAGGCTHDLAQKLAGLPPTNPPTFADSWNMWLGVLIHEAMQKVVAKAFPDAQAEVKCELDVDGSAHIDIELTDHDGRLTVVEMKSIGGFGFKMQATSFKGAPEGPKNGHVLQAALSAKVRNADRLVVIYLAKELISKNQASSMNLSELGRFVAQFSMEREEFLPLAEQENKRVEWVMGRLRTDDGARLEGDELLTQVEAMPRLITTDEGDIAHVTNPRTGLFEVRAEGEILQSGTTWMCNYCWNRDRCVAFLEGEGG